MKKKMIRIFLLIVLIVGGLAAGIYCINQFGTNRTGNTGQKAAADQDTDTVADGVDSAAQNDANLQRPKDQSPTTIPQFHSSVDKDEDGVDDQVDILEGALAYVATHPIYESRYYNTGYPDDGYGVCTDVVANALKSAGYDLMELIDQDIRKNPKTYGIEQPDKNIDFRRVSNQRVYFERHAVSLTTDITKTDQWQGGDIVVFKKHIGIVSDRRNKYGIPFVIHHNTSTKDNYEQDILGKRTDIVGHYRLSE